MKTHIIEKEEEEEEEGLTNLNKKFIYDEAIYVYKTSETKTFYSEYIQKKYQNVQAPFPTRNTKTVVIGNNEENINDNTYFVNSNNVIPNANFVNNGNFINNRTLNNASGDLCPDCQQMDIYEQNMV